MRPTSTVITLAATLLAAGAAHAADGDVDLHYEIKPAQDGRVDEAKVRGTLQAGDTRVRSLVRIDPRGDEGPAAGVDVSWELPGVGPLRNVAVGDGTTSGGGWSASRRLTGVRAGAASGELKPMAAGATGYRLEAGRIRDGMDSLDRTYVTDYGSAAWRTGLADWVTLELRAEQTTQQRAHGVELVQDIGGLRLQALAAESSGAGSAGRRWGLRLAQPGTFFTWRLGYNEADRDFRSLAGGAEAEKALRVDTSLRMAGQVTAEASLTRKHNWDAAEPSSELALGTQLQLPGRTKMRVDMTRSFSETQAWRAGVSVSVPLE